MTVAPEIPRTIATADLCRSVPFELVREDGDQGDGLTFRGYAAVFNEPTEIDSWEGRFTEQVAPGAFKRTLRANVPVFQFDHGSHPMIGSIPLGNITDTREDERGVYVEARLEDNWLVQPVRDAIKSGSVSGMSFRFEVVRDRWTTPDGKVLTDPEDIMERIYRPSPDGLLLRTLLEVKSREMGPVVFPAYTGTSAAVRSITIDPSKPMSTEQQGELARAVFMADHAAASDEDDGSERVDPDRTNDPPDPEGTADEAPADHEGRNDDTPQGTADAPAEHESETAEPAGLRDSIKRWRRLNAPSLRFAQERQHHYE